MHELITATDLAHWSGTRQAQGHLPSLVRAAVMATVAPVTIRFPAAEGVGEPGFDGVVEVTGGAPPYVPAGLSVWEIGTSEDVGRKAAEDYRKRKKQLTAAERARTTFVFVTSRRWSGAAAWTERRDTDGWAGVRAYDAQDLALWLENVPGVRARFSELLGRQPYGVTPLSRWADDWCNTTVPPLPPEVLLAWRRRSQPSEEVTMGGDEEAGRAARRVAAGVAVRAHLGAGQLLVMLPVSKTLRLFLDA